MPATCTVTLDHLGGCVNQKEYEISNLYVGDLNEFTVALNAAETEMTGVTVSESSDGAADATYGLVEFSFEGTTLDLIEEGTHDDGKNTWKDTLENLKVYSPDTADDAVIRNLLGSEIWGIVKLKGKAGESQYKYRTFGINGGVKFINLRRAVTDPSWAMNIDGSGEIRQVYFKPTAAADAAAIDTVIASLIRS